MRAGDVQAPLAFDYGKRRVGVAVGARLNGTARPFRTLKAEGHCVVFSSHVMQEVGALCDRVVVVAAGKKTAEGTLEELRALTGKDTLEDAFVAAVGTDEGLQ